MTDHRHKKAEALAQRGYVSFAFRDQTTDDEPIYVALNPELAGCMAQGETMQEALANLEEVRVEYIEHLIEHELPVPAPAWDTGIKTSERSPSEIRLTIHPESAEFANEKDHLEAERPNIKLVTA